MERQPESELEGESAEEGLTEDLARLSIARVEAERDLATFPAIVAYADHPGALNVEITGPREITVSRIQGITPILSLEPNRFYVVWGLPGCTGGWNLVGIHVGAGNRAYQALISLNGGFANLRFRRVESLAEARIQFVREAVGHGVSRDRVDYRCNWL